MEEMEMENSNLKESIAGLNMLKKDAQETMKKGLPFVLASVVIWGLILVVQSLDLDLSVKNMCTFVCCVLLMPLAILFSNAVGADIFRKTPNPVNKLALLNTLNQFLYILIVMWAFSRAPEYMVMVYAMVFGAHLLPFSWAYDSKAYLVISIVETVGALVLYFLLGSIAVAAFIVIGEIGLSTLLGLDCKKNLS